MAWLIFLRYPNIRFAPLLHLPPWSKSTIFLQTFGFFGCTRDWSFQHCLQIRCCSCYFLGYFRSYAASTSCLRRIIVMRALFIGFFMYTVFIDKLFISKSKPLLFGQGKHFGRGIWNELYSGTYIPLSVSRFDNCIHSTIIVIPLIVARRLLCDIPAVLLTVLSCRPFSWILPESGLFSCRFLVYLNISGYDFLAIHPSYKDKVCSKTNHNAATASPCCEMPPASKPYRSSGTEQLRNNLVSCSDCLGNPWCMTQLDSFTTLDRVLGRLLRDAVKWYQQIYGNECKVVAHDLCQFVRPGAPFQENRFGHSFQTMRGKPNGSAGNAYTSRGICVLFANWWYDCRNQHRLTT